MDDNLIDLGTKFQIELRLFSNNIARFTIEKCIAALEASTTLTELTLSFDQYEPTPESMRRVIKPLCHCISNLRLHNAQHPLRQMVFHLLHIVVDELEGVFAQFLVAAKRFGIFHMRFIGVLCLPIQVFVDFCRDNNILKVLNLNNVSFSGGAAALPLSSNNGPPNNSVILTLDKLFLHDIKFVNSTAATVFADLVAHVNVSSLFLGEVTARKNHDEEEDDDTQITERILSELKMPSVEHLTLYTNCRMENFNAALDAGMTTVTDLKFINWPPNPGGVAARLELLASFIRRAVKLNSLTIRRETRGLQRTSSASLFQALEACATATQIQVSNYNCQGVLPVSEDEKQLLQKITTRNRGLDRFVTNPGTYPTEELPELMRQFDNCPTGRYMLARRLPEVLPFAELYAMHLSRRRTKPPSSKKSKLQ